MGCLVVKWTSLNRPVLLELWQEEVVVGVQGGDSRTLIF